MSDQPNRLDSDTGNSRVDTDVDDWTPHSDVIGGDYVLSLPYNPNVVGRLRKPPYDAPSKADHLAPREEQERGTNAHGFYKRLTAAKKYKAKTKTNTTTAATASTSANANANANTNAKHNQPLSPEKDPAP